MLRSRSAVRIAVAVVVSLAVPVVAVEAATGSPAPPSVAAGAALDPEASILAAKYGMTPAQAQTWIDRAPVLDALEQKLAVRLPDRFAGIWTEEGRRVSVAVVGPDRSDVQAVLAEELDRPGLGGAVTVRPASVGLRRLREQAEAAVTTIGGRQTAEVEVSVPRNTVVVRVAPATAPSARLALGTLAGSVQVEETAEVNNGGACASTGSCTPTHGGSYMRATGAGCSVGLPARSAAGIWYGITAGHCIGSGSGNWSHANTAMGPGVRWEYGNLGPDGSSYGTDLGAFRYAYHLPLWNARSRVIVTTSQATVVTRPIRAAMETRTGDPACMTGGRSTYTDCGIVASPNRYLTYASPGLPARTIYNVTSVTDVCLRPGDSGSPVFTSDRILGIGVTYDTACNRMHFARIAVALTKYKLSIIP